MIWQHYGPSHWVCKDFPGYEIHARCRPKRNAKTIFDSWKESWVVQTSLNNKVIQKFNKQDHIQTAMDKASSYVKFCLEFQENVIKKTLSTKVTEEEVKRLREEFYKSIDSSKTWQTPIIT